MMNAKSLLQQSGQSCQAGGRMLASASRKLANSTVEFQVIYQTFWSYYDCSDVQAIVNAFADNVKQAICTSIENGALDASIQANAAAGSVTDLLIVLVNSGEISNVGYTIPPELAAALALRKWYPDWEDSQSVTCKNDNNEPNYMLLNQMWLIDLLEACCNQFFSYNKDICTVEGGGPVSFILILYVNESFLFANCYSLN